VRTPSELHPIFYGSFDWHSCVHGYWLLARLYRRFPEMIPASAIRELFDTQFTESNVDGELAYLAQPMRAGFERPYGWAWALMLAAELTRHTSTEGRRWSAAIAPLGTAFAERFLQFLPKTTYPIRVGTHFNTAFAARLTIEYANTVGDTRLGTLISAQALSWFGEDADCQAWEPGGDDFLSSALMEAECMRCMLPPQQFAAWFDQFLPHVAIGEPATLFNPVTVSDRSDGKIGHLDGLNLSRAWCWRSIAEIFSEADTRRPLVLETIDRHLVAALPHVAGDYMGEHWLATFALLALDP